MAVMTRRAPSSGLRTAMWAAKIALLVVGALSVGAAARAALPLAAGLPRLWSFLCGFLSPPYLFVVVHLIIVVIWKLSDQKQHHPFPAADDEKPPPEIPAKHKDLGTPPLSRKPTPEIWAPISTAVEEPGGSSPAMEESGGSSPAMEEPGGSSPASVESCVTTEADEGSTFSSRLEIKNSLRTPPETARPPAKAPAVEKVEEGEAAPEIENDTIDATWQAIMAKSPRVVAVPPERETIPPPAKAKAPAAMPAIAAHEELDRRFEDFIKKNHDQIRLQRHESNQRRLAMANVASC